MSEHIQYMGEDLKLPVLLSLHCVLMKQYYILNMPIDYAILFDDFPLFNAIITKVLNIDLGSQYSVT